MSQKGDPAAMARLRRMDGAMETRSGAGGSTSCKPQDHENNAESDHARASGRVMGHGGVERLRKA